MGASQNPESCSRRTGSVKSQNKRNQETQSKLSSDVECLCWQDAVPAVRPLPRARQVALGQRPCTFSFSPGPRLPFWIALSATRTGWGIACHFGRPRVWRATGKPQDAEFNLADPGGFYRVSRVSSQHPARPRCPWEGPLVQLGASEGVLQMERSGGNPAPLHRGRASVQIHRHLNLEPELICTLKD